MLPRYLPSRFGSIRGIVYEEICLKNLKIVVMAVIMGSNKGNVLHIALMSPIKFGCDLTYASGDVV